MLTPGEVRDRLTRFIFVSQRSERSDRPAGGDVRQGGRGGAAEKKLDRAVRAGQVRRVHGTDWIGEAAKQGVITEREAAAARARDADGARHRRRPFRSGRGAAALHDAGPQRAGDAERRGRMRQACHDRCNALRDWRFSIDPQGIAWAVFDREGESQNSLGRRPLEELGAIVERVEQGARDKSHPRPGLHLRQGEGLHRRRRRARVRAAHRPSAGDRQRDAWSTPISTASSGCRCRWCAASTASAWAAGSSWRSPATGASPRAMMPRASASPR